MKKLLLPALLGAFLLTIGLADAATVGAKAPATPARGTKRRHTTTPGAPERKVPQNDSVRVHDRNQQLDIALRFSMRRAAMPQEALIDAINTASDAEVLETAQACITILLDRCRTPQEKFSMLVRAIQKNCAPLIRKLLQADCPLMSEIAGTNTALIEAVLSDNVEAADILLDADDMGEHVNKLTVTGLTACDLAAEKPELLKILRNYGGKHSNELA